MLPDKVYNVLKWICLIVLPAAATFYGVISKIWGLPYGTEIPATITAVSVFIGAIIGVSTHNYNKSLDERED